MRRRAQTLTVAGVGVLAAAAAATATFGFGPDPAAPTADDDLPPQRAQVVRETMLDTTDVAGELGYTGTTTLAGRIPGVITRMPLPGDVIGRGRPIYRVDNTPIVLMYGSVAAYRSLGPGSTGSDVRQLEQNLKALGYHGFTVDAIYSSATATAVREWQEDHGLPRTGRVEQGRVVFAPEAIRVAATAAGVNESTGGAAAVLTYTTTGRQVTVRLAIGQQRLARRGTTVRIQLPNGTVTAGRVDRVFTIVEPADAGGQDETRIQVTVSLADPAAAAGIEAAVVNVTFTAGQREHVLSVPVAALVALAEGGYGVEVIDGTTTHYVRIQTGLFANGRVEVTGDGLEEGTTVGMPR
ncbi:peptidoglycan-binding protein [Asanoa sp. NPDC049573]|uniref:peptidoglycan-binding protein n=1 Tax=Asanoa sp. NPDC049573 TaxID=3155396 RepID=UPI00343A1D79